MDVTNSRGDRDLVETLVSAAAPTVLWLTDHIADSTFEWLDRRQNGEVVGYEAPGA
jgi:hypothetical protein